MPCTTTYLLYLEPLLHQHVLRAQLFCYQQGSESSSNAIPALGQRLGHITCLGSCDQKI